MGKKKSVVLIVLVTILIAALAFISVATFAIPSTVNIFNSLLNTVELGTDLGGGYYTVYYPEGVITQDEYQLIESQYKQAQEEGNASDYVNPEDYTKHKGIYLSNDIIDAQGNVDETFAAEFEKAYKALSYRFEHKNLSGYSVKLQDDYTVLVQVPYTDESVDDLFTMCSYRGTLLFTDDEGNDMYGEPEYISKASVISAGDAGYAVEVRFTEAGAEEFYSLTSAIFDTANADQEESSSGSLTTANNGTLYIKLGDETLMQAEVESAMTQSAIYISGSFSTRGSAGTVASIINSSLHEDMLFDIELSAPQIYTFEPTMGENVALIAAIVIGVLALAMIVYSLIRYKGMGLAHVYGFLTFALLYIAALALIDLVSLNAVGLLAAVFCAAMCVGLNFYAFGNIRREFYDGKTLTMSIRNGYNKSLALTIEVHAVLLLAAIAMYFIATGTVHFMAMVLIIGTVLSAAVTLGITRFYLYMFLAQPKNKIAFCNLKGVQTENE